ncbi:MAG TPA: hypothetical protein VIS06_02380, partial [Mycobacteriales bacterium]
MTGAPLERAHRMHRRYRRRSEIVRGLLAGIVAVTAVLGVPVLLVAVVGNPLPNSDGGLFTGSAARIAVRTGACLAWLGWAQFLPCLLVEVLAGVRGQGLPRRVRVAVVPVQDLARRLVVPMLLLSADQGLRSAAPPVVDAGGRPGPVLAQPGP